MRHSRYKATICNSRVVAVRHRFIMVALSVLVVLTFLTLQAHAQVTGADCPDGLIKPNEAGTGTLLLKTATPGCYLPAPQIATGIDVDIAGPIARTRITQRFQNPAEGWVEGLYVFPLPEGSAVDTLKMIVGERLIEGEIRERGEARRIYETAKAEGRTASLVEQIRPNIFNNNVANIGPFETIIVQIEYQESLRFDAGRYHLRVPFVVAPRYAPRRLLHLTRLEDGGVRFEGSDLVPEREKIAAPVLRPEFGKINPVSLTVQLEAGFDLGTVESSSHEILIVRNGTTGATVALRDVEVPADRDFALSFSPADNRAPVISLLRENWNGEEYVLALVVPPAPSAAVARQREVVFVLDNSGSMGGASIRQAKASLLLALDRLTSTDRFNVVRFDNTTAVLFPAPVDATLENVAFAKGFVASIEARGGTEMMPALLAALDDPLKEDRSHLRQVIFLTDGAVGNEAELFAAIDQELGRSRLFTVGIGSAPNSYFMSGAARAGRGTYTYIGSADDVVPRMAELFAKLEHPVMTDLVAEWPGGLSGEAWPNPLPDLYLGEPILFTMRAQEAQGILTLSGNMEGVVWRRSFDLVDARSASGIEKLWARNKIAALEESRVRGASTAQIDQAVLGVALEHHLTSRLTSLVAVDLEVRRAANAPLTSHKIPLNLPEGWDFDKVFGEFSSNPEQHTQAGFPDVILTQLRVSDTPAAALKPDDAGLLLPQGGTASYLLLIAGIAFLLLGSTLLIASGHRGGA